MLRRCSYTMLYRGAGILAWISRVRWNVPHLTSAGHGHEFEFQLGKFKLSRSCLRANTAIPVDLAHTGL